MWMHDPPRTTDPAPGETHSQLVREVSANGRTLMRCSCAALAVRGGFSALLRASLHLGVRHVARRLLRLCHEEQPAVLRSPRPAEQVHLAHAIAGSSRAARRGPDPRMAATRRGWPWGRRLASAQGSSAPPFVSRNCLLLAQGHKSWSGKGPARRLRPAKRTAGCDAGESIYLRSCLHLGGVERDATEARDEKAMVVVNRRCSDGDLWHGRV